MNYHRNVHSSGSRNSRGISESKLISKVSVTARAITFDVKSRMKCTKLESAFFMISLHFSASFIFKAVPLSFAALISSMFMYISPSSYEIFKTSDKLRRISSLLPVCVERRKRICSRWITRASTCPHDETAWLVSVSSPFQRLGERGTAWSALQGAEHDQKHSLHNIQEVIIQENYKVEFNKI